MAQINAALNLVLPIRSGEDGTALLYAYHTPISRDVFEANYRIISATKGELFAGMGHSEKRRMAQSLSDASRIATLTFKDEAKRDAIEHGFDFDNPESPPPGYAFLAELERLTLVLAPTANGWEQIPVAVAIGRKLIDQDEWAEVLSSIVFFTCGLSMVPKNGRMDTATFLALIVTGSITSLPPTEWTVSLPKSTTGTTSEAKAPTLLVPS